MRWSDDLHSSEFYSVEGGGGREREKDHQIRKGIIIKQKKKNY